MKRPYADGIATVLIIFVFIALTMCLPDSFGKMMHSVAVMGAYTYIPFCVNNAAEVSEKDEKTENVKVKSTYKTENNGFNTFFETDDDILKLIEKYQSKAKNDKKDAAISEENLHESGKNQSYQGVYVKNTNKTSADIENHLSQKAKLSVKTDKPSVLVYHTHTTETYQLIDRDFYATGFKSRSSSVKQNMVRVGEALCSGIEKNGFTVIHDKTVYDSVYSGAYYRSYDAAQEIVESNPTVQITLDIHRDAIQYNSGTKVKPVVEINGKKAAQIMIITGCQEDGNGIEGFTGWEDNLVFALQLQKQLETDWEGLTRPVFFCARDYNMNLTPCSLLIEIGTDANTLDEAVYSAKLLGVSLGRLMENYIEKD